MAERKKLAATGMNEFAVVVCLLEHRNYDALNNLIGGRDALVCFKAVPVRCGEY